YYRVTGREVPLSYVDDEENQDAFANITSGDGHQPDTLLAAKQDVTEFLRLLESLPEAQREAFLLHEEAGMSIEEIAMATGVSAETAKSRLRYALGKLREGLKEVV
ncbi:MAG: sigma-70 family RNA polymerase sigma factor, partial [Burkholderiales bacterium]